MGSKGRGGVSEAGGRDLSDFGYPAAASYLSYKLGTSEEYARELIGTIASLMSSDILFGYPSARRALNGCESPAERLLLLGGMFRTGGLGAWILFYPSPLNEGAAEAFEKLSPGRWVGELVGSEDGSSRFGVFQQAQIGAYRVDFYLPKRRLVVEVDGHDFHRGSAYGRRPSTRRRSDWSAPPRVPRPRAARPGRSESFRGPGR